MANPESFRGSTSRFLRVRPGVLLKYPAQIRKESKLYEQLTAKIANNFAVERQILGILGEHPRIVTYLGWQDEPEGLLLAEASHGSLQRYLDEHGDAVPSPLRKKWCRQVVESIAYIHHRGVVHSDLRPDNFLVHATTPTSLDLRLCDFGGSTCEGLGLDGGSLPDSGFFDPNSEPEASSKASTSTDIFSIASVLYTILTGHWPYRRPGPRPFESCEELEDYQRTVDGLFQRGEFPDVDGIWGGVVIMRCWMNEYASAQDVLRALESEMREEIS
ncbi:kinase-like domain-containing protein [Biscogniauxia marginata]|nr:kinase-like domain-containing protein [Biscogniauxia marginata]